VKPLRSLSRYFVAFSLVAGAAHAGGSLAEDIAAALARGETRITIPPGEHRLAEPIRLNGLRDVTIDGRGATLVFTEMKNGGILVTDCEGLTLSGFTVDFDPLPFTQGTVESIDAEKREVTFQLHDGYPDLAAHFLTGRAHVFSPDTLSWKPNAADIYATEARALTPRRGVLRFSPNKGEEFASFAVGDHVVLDHRHSRGLRAERCRDLRIEGVTFWSAPSIAVIARFMDGKNVFSYSIRRGPTPAGATMPRLLSVSADGLNYAYARTGPVIEHCDFSFMGDDSVNLHGIAFFVAKSEGNTVWLLRPYAEEAFATVIAPGDEVLGLAAGNFDVTGRARVSSFSTETNPPGDFSALAARTWKSVAVKGGRLTVYRLELDAPLALDAGDFLEIPAIAAPGYVIRDNRFAHHRARGLRLMSSDGLVENNVFEDIKQSAITLGAEFAFHREAGWVRDVVVRGNTLRRVAHDPALRRPTAYMPGAISVFHRGESPDLPRAAAKHERLRIEDNVIEDTAGPAIHVYQADDLVIARNRIARSNLVPAPRAGERHGLTTDGPVRVEHSSNVRVEP